MEVHFNIGYGSNRCRIIFLYCYMYLKTSDYIVSHTYSFISITKKLAFGSKRSFNNQINPFNSGYTLYHLIYTFAPLPFNSSSHNHAVHNSSFNPYLLPIHPLSPILPFPLNHDFSEKRNAARTLAQKYSAWCVYLHPPSSLFQ